MANFTPQQIEEFLQEFFDTVGTRQYIGARYVPLFGRKGEESIAWDNSAPYEPLTIVTHEGDTYTSRQYVPAGVDIANADYWALTGPYNSQIEQYREEVLRFDDRITANSDAIAQETEARIEAVDAEAAARIEAVDAEASTREQEIDDLRQYADGEFVPFPDQPDSKYGALGQVLSTKANGTTQWVNPVTPSPADVATAVSDWLDDHPEATTTVEDGSITTAKIADGAVKTADLDPVDGVLPSDMMHNAWRVPFSNKTNYLFNGVNYVWTGNQLEVFGTPTAQAFQNVYRSETAFPLGVSAGDTLIVECPSNPNVRIAKFDWVNGDWGNYQQSQGNRPYTLFDISPDATGMIIRIEVLTSFDGTSYRFVPTVTTRGSNPPYPQYWGLYANDKTYYPAGSLNDAPINCCTFLSSGINYTEMPTDIAGYRTGFLLTFRVSYTIREQIYIQAETGYMYGRYSLNDNWYPWHKVSADALDIPYQVYLTETTLADAPVNKALLLTEGITYTDTPQGFTTGMLATFALYSGWKVQMLTPLAGSRMYKRYIHSSTVSDWELIGDDTTVQPTGDDTNRTTAITQRLTTHGICRLAPGTYYVSEITMPEGTTIEGCGESTVLRLIDGASSGTIKVKSRCTVANVRIVGADTGEFDETSTVGNRHGIVFTAYDGTNPENVHVDGVRIENMTGSGIYCHDTGGNVKNALSVTNVYVKNCVAGVYIPTSSEYHNFTNVKVVECHYGVVNNGGNNIFANCSFTGNKMGALLDNTSGTLTNVGHGTFVGCNFNHEDDNDGIAIKMVNIIHGFVVQGCQLWYGSVDVEGSTGIVFGNCLFGRVNNGITIDGGGLVMLDGCAFGTVPTITVTDNANVKVNACYAFDGSVVTAA